MSQQPVRATPIRVLVVEDHPMTRSGLELFMHSFADLDLLGLVANGEAAIAFCETQRPDVVLMDLKLPGLDGVTATYEIRQRFPEVQVIALTSYEESGLVERALQAGAISYLLKDISAEDLAQAIRSAYAGHSVLAQAATEALIKLMRQQAPPSFKLTDREREVLTFLAKGLSNTEIAQQLRISPATVKFHVSGIIAKLGVGSRAEVVALAWQLRLIS